MSVHCRLLPLFLILSIGMAFTACGREPPATEPPSTSPLISMSEPSLAALITPPSSPPTETPAPVPTETPSPSSTPPPPVPTQTPTEILTPIPTATSTLTPTLTQTATAVPTSTPTDTPTPIPTAIPTLTPTPTETATATQTPIPDRPELYSLVQPPIHMATAYWYWYPLEEVTHTSVEIPFTLHNDPTNFSDVHGLYLILTISEISDTLFYFGIQTGVSGKRNENTGKGVIFSRWDERDLSNARVPSDCFATSSGGEGDFIGLRCPYEWTTGAYSARIAFESEDAVGEWYGLWITDEASGSETWIGSLRFPKSLSRSRGLHSGLGYSLEIYGNPRIRPIDIPYWHVTLSPPIGSEASTPGWVAVYYDGHGGEQLNNSDAWWNADEGHVRFVVGGATTREHDEQEIWLADE